jgi:hypothetical protein
MLIFSEDTNERDSKKKKYCKVDEKEGKENCER